jgi:hypothetical protein
MSVQVPDMLVIEHASITAEMADLMGEHAANLARLTAPKLSGRSAGRIEAVGGEGWFGIHWQDDYVWYQEQGIRPFTMHRLAGKTIPMWINDPTGEEARKNPKAEQRVTADGRRQVLIFRRAALHGQRKTVRRRRGGVWRDVSVPASYPGAPGRIANREKARPFTTPGKVGGQIAKGNVGVRWRHPGLNRRGWLWMAMARAAKTYGLTGVTVIAAKAA